MPANSEVFICQKNGRGAWIASIKGKTYKEAHMGD